MVRDHVNEPKFPHFTNDFILSVDEAVVVRVLEHDDSSAWKLFAKAFRLFLFTNGWFVY